MVCDLSTIWPLSLFLYISVGLWVPHRSVSLTVFIYVLCRGGTVVLLYSLHVVKELQRVPYVVWLNERPSWPTTKRSEIDGVVVRVPVYVSPVRDLYMITYKYPQMVFHSFLVTGFKVRCPLQVSLRLYVEETYVTIVTFALGTLPWTRSVPGRPITTVGPMNWLVYLFQSVL